MRTSHLKNPTLYTVTVTLLLCLHALSQSTIWNPSSFAFSRDTVSFEDMTGATAANFSAAFSSTSLADFPSGFSFQFGVTQYTKFTISSYGYIKLGRPITAINPTLQDTIISALYAFNNVYVSSYKVVGTAPNRRLIIDWSGNFMFAGAVRFQLWLYERIGKIQFIYSGQNSYSVGNGYMIYCKTRIFNQPVLASLKSKPSNQLPTVNYAAYESSNYDAIAAKTRYTFQPDTIKPVAPPLSFANVVAGCVDVLVKDSSINESVFVLARKDSGTTYNDINYFFSKTSATKDTSYVYNNKRLQPDSTYSYRSFASNGFINSDTVIKLLHTPMPMIFGVKKIPGDYPSIKALLDDAQCKHLGPQLTIELQSSYSYANEGNSTVYVNAFLQTKVLRRVTIAPAAGANVLISGGNALPLFIIDSVRNFGFDGRAGGVGTSNNLTIRQLDTLRPAISYTHFADSGFINYCNIEGRCKNATFALIYLGGYEPYLYAFAREGVSGTIVSNCKIGPATGFNLKGIVVDPNGKGENITIRENEFFRFYNEAIEFRGGGQNCHITRNRLYQPEIVSFLSNTNQANAAIFLNNTGEGLVVDSNKFGGSAAAWGMGNWNQYISPFNNYSVIYLKPSYWTVNSYIRNNEIANMTYSGSSACEIRVLSGRVVIADNRLGSADSVNSIIQYSHHTGIAVYSQGMKVISGNFLSGIQTDYPSFSTTQTLVLIYVEGVDSLLITKNDIGGSDNPLANRSGNRTFGIDLTNTKYAIIRSNVIRGISSVYNVISGISEEWAGATNGEKNMIADSNKIHHLQGYLTAFGIYARLYSNRKNSFSNNEIYSIKASGPYASIGASHPDIILGIDVEHFLFPDKNTFDTSEVNLSNNKIHSFEYYTPTAFYPFPMRAIAVSGRNIKIQNNMIQLGIGSNGQPTDSLELETHGIAVGPNDVDPIVRAQIEHNSLYIGGTGHIVSGISVPVDTSQNKNIIVSNNIIHIERYQASSISNEISFMLGTSAVNKIRNVMSNNNIWYSQRIPDVSQKLASWKATCECDSSTFVGNPLFIKPSGDSATWNLHLSPGSVADASGTPPFALIPRDIDNELRSDYSPVDIGADAIRPCAGNLSSVQLQLSSAQDTVRVCSATNYIVSVTISGGTVDQLQWQRNLNDIAGAATNSYTVTQPGFYRVVGKLSCGKIASKTILVIFGGTPPVVNLSPGDTSICLGSSATLSASGATSYNWSPTTGLTVTSTSTAVVQPSSTTTYTVTGFSGGCAATKSATISVIPNVVPTVSISQSSCVNSSITYTASPTNAGVSPVYKWYVNNVLVDTGRVFTYDNVINGSEIYVQLTSSALCATPRTVSSLRIAADCIVTAAPNIDGLEEFLVSPNPTDGLIVVRLKLNRLKKVYFAVIDGTGRQVYVSLTKTMSGSNKEQIDLRRYASGSYYLRTSINDKIVIRKIVINR